jgi:hypothetical protein
MKPQTLQTIEEIIIISLIIASILIFFFGLFYLLYYTETPEERIYEKCLDNCQRVFIEEKLLNCIQICNENLKGGNTNQK